VQELDEIDDEEQSIDDNREPIPAELIVHNQVWTEVGAILVDSASSYKFSTRMEHSRSDHIKVLMKGVS
jgi:hypothetical protein